MKKRLDGGTRRDGFGSSSGDGASRGGAKHGGESPRHIQLDAKKESVMKKRVFGSMIAIAGMLLLTTLPSSVSGQEGIVSEFRGELLSTVPVCLGDRCVGDLVTCEESNVRSTNRSIVTYMKNACDDFAAESACAGRLTLLSETCINVGRDISVAGTLVSIRASGKQRICFDEDAASDCTDPLPGNVVVVQEADIHSNTRRTVIPFQMTPSGNPMHSDTKGNIEATPTATTPFTINGRSVELSSDIIVADFTIQGDPDNDSCEAINALQDGSAGCGIAGVGVAASQTPVAARCCADCDDSGEVEINELVTGVNNGLLGCPER